MNNTVIITRTIFGDEESVDIASWDCFRHWNLWFDSKSQTSHWSTMYFLLNIYKQEAMYWCFFEAVPVQYLSIPLQHPPCGRRSFCLRLARWHTARGFSLSHCSLVGWCEWDQSRCQNHHPRPLPTKQYHNPAGHTPRLLLSCPIRHHTLSPSLRHQTAPLDLHICLCHQSAAQPAMLRNRHYPII